jgi:hypothetical protein
MKSSRHATGLAVLFGALVTGCGGGGASTSSGSGDQSDPPPASGSYTGTYACAATNGGSDLIFTAVLPTPTGVLSSCSGSAMGRSLTISCTGSIASDGTLKIDGSDDHGSTVSILGIASETEASGTYGISGGVRGDFRCTH